MLCPERRCIRCVILWAALAYATPSAVGQDSNQTTNWEYKAVAFQTENEGTKKLNELAQEGWVYVGPLSNGLVAFKRPSPHVKPERRIMRINGYNYELPPWWDSVKVTVPKGLTNETEVSEYVKKHYGKEVGTQETWKQSLKTWALWCEEHDYFPIYVAHCHATGSEHRRAAEIYADIARILKDKRMDESWAWYQCFLSFEAGESYALIDDVANARKFLGRAAEFVGNENKAVSHYAEEASKLLKQLDEKEKKEKK
jgi:hypothetical protein